MVYFFLSFSIIRINITIHKQNTTRLWLISSIICIACIDCGISFFSSNIKCQKTLSRKKLCPQNIKTGIYKIPIKKNTLIKATTIYLALKRHIKNMIRLDQCHAFLRTVKFNWIQNREKRELETYFNGHMCLTYPD